MKPKILIGIKEKCKLWLPVILWATIIFIFSSLPTVKASHVYWREFVIKKSAHIVEFAVLSILMYRALKNTGYSKQTSSYYTIAIASFYGITDEIHQMFTPGREPTIRDALFDTIGAILAIYFIWKLLPIAPKRLKSWAKKLRIY